MSSTRQAVVELAQSQVGYTETGTNIVKYWTFFDKDVWQWYNTKKQGAEWCQGFLAWITCQIIGPDEALKFFGIPSVKDNCSAAVPYFWNYLVNKGYKIDKTAGKEGDFIFLNDKKHIGVIEYADGSTYHTIEGNHKNKVARETYSKTDSYVYGVCRMPWELYDSPEPQPTPTPSTVTVKLDVLQRGSTGGQVQTIQALLNGFIGSKLSVDGIFGAKTEEGVKEYQRTRGLTVDGIVGEKTWNRILK